MAAVSGISSATSTISKVFSKLGDNAGSVVPMYVKDITSDTLTSLTYFKDGGNQDGAEKTLEEFGTGVLWLGGIPFLKKVFDKTIYKKCGINPDIDAKRLFSGNNKNSVNTLEFAKEKAASLGEEFGEQAKILADTIKDKGKAQKLAIGKFGLATAATGLALFGLITYKQKRTEKEIEKQVKEKQAKAQQLKGSALKNSLKDNAVYQAFQGNSKNIHQGETCFKGLGSFGTFLMSNPVANTALVDCVITGTRLGQAREGERFEVGLKEACELIFIYGLAQPLQKGMEAIAKNFFNKPINLDYSVLDSNVIKEAIQAEKAEKGSSVLLQQAKKIVELGGGKEKEGAKGIKGIIEKGKAIINHTNSMPNESAKKVINFVFDNHDSAMAEILTKTGDVGVFETAEKVKQLSLLSSIDADKVKKTAQNTIDIIENAVTKGDTVKYLKQTKFLKGAAIIGNIAISAILMGYLQPKLNLYLRKKLHNGDNTNPAIRNLENEITQKLAFQGQNEETKKTA